MQIRLRTHWGAQKASGRAGKLTKIDANKTVAPNSVKHFDRKSLCLNLFRSNGDKLHAGSVSKY